MVGVSDNQESRGMKGSDTITSTGAHTGTWWALDILEDTIFTLLTGNATGYAGVTYPAGTILRGHFTAITLASGSIVAYRRS